MTNTNRNMSKQAQIRIYFNNKSAITVLEYKHNPQDAIASLEQQLGLTIDHWHFDEMGGEA